MKNPKRLDFNPEQIEALIERLNSKQLTDQDYPLLADLIRALAWLNVSLQEKQLSIQRLRSIFGIKTESAKKLIDFANRTTGDKSPEDEQDSSESDSSANQESGQDQSSSPESEQQGEKKKKGKHGRRPSSDFTQAKTIHIAHQTLKKGSLCPECFKGRLFQLSSGTVLRIVGQPWLEIEIYRPERFRCSLCGKVFTAILPQDLAVGSRADSSAKAIVSLLKYRGGVPFYRQGQIQQALGNPISASEIWEMTRDVADAALPIYAFMCTKASEAELIQNDDTTARVLSIMEERKKKMGTEEEEERTGTFTTAILATLSSLDVKIALFFTGRKHAGENLDDLLENRPDELPPPIQHCDAGNNHPKNHETELSNCLSHARRKFYEVVKFWPVVVIKVIGWFSAVFANERSAPSGPTERLKWHQEKSKPIMEEMKKYLDGLIERREVEPNSSLGKAIAYLDNHWKELTLFLRVSGVPIHNNDNERLIKRAVLNRKNAYFFRNETGAKIGDILLSLMETCILNGKNPWDYLIAIQEYQQDVQRNTALWLPWNFEIRLKELRPP
jgi:transposase